MPSVSGLTKERNFYKPFSYPFAYEAYKLQSQMHWLPEEIALHEDVRDWNTKLSVAEKELLSQLFRFFTQSDIDIAGGYIDKYLPVFKPPEVRMMLSTFAAMEAIHIDAYSLLLETIGMPEIEYQRFQSYVEMVDKHKFIVETPSDSPQEFAKAMAVYSAFGEGLQLFSSFAILLNFQRFGKMRGMGQIITWSVRDESLHVNSMIRLFLEYCKEFKITTKELKEPITEACQKMVELEDRFIDLAFSSGGTVGLEASEVKQYIRYIADRRLLQLRLKPVYGVKENPLDWLDWVLNGVEHMNFFEGRATAYSKGSLIGNWEDCYPK